MDCDASGRHVMRVIKGEGEVALGRLRDELTSVGLSVEALPIAMFGTEQEVKLEVEITSNRPDCMNHLGLAREIAVKRGTALRPPVFSFTESLLPNGPQTSVKIDDPEGCPRFTARIIRGVKIGPSPEWLVRRLEAIGSRPINNVVDATNFCLWESGQPLHAYDLATVPGGELAVRRARSGEKLITLDGKERELDPEVLVIADRVRAIGLAGIMGGLDTEVTGATTDVLLEAAHFDRRRIRIGAKRLGMHTDASHRFERGADFEICEEASRRCAALIAEVAGGTIEGPGVDAIASRPQPVAWRLAGPELEDFGAPRSRTPKSSASWQASVSRPGRPPNGCGRASSRPGARSISSPGATAFRRARPGGRTSSKRSGGRPVSMGFRRPCRHWAASTVARTPSTTGGTACATGWPDSATPRASTMRSGSAARTAPTLDSWARVSRSRSPTRCRSSTQ